MNYKEKRKDLVNKLKRSNVLKSKKVIDAFLEVKRENFVTEENKNKAYIDSALSLFREQTISQPTTIAIMTEALELKKGDKVLEIGTGSGYQSAIIKEIIGDEGEIYSLEIIKELHDFANKNLKKEGYNINLIHKDGGEGLKKESPFDKIIVTCALPKLLENLTEQLKEKGILVAPVEKLSFQQMIKVKKINNKLKKENLGLFSFVPLTGKFKDKR